MFTSFKTESTEIDSLYSAAQAEYAKKDYRAALLAFNKLLKAAPHYALGIQGKTQVLKKLSEEAFNQKDFQLAESYAKEASQICPEPEQQLALARLRHQVYSLTTSAPPALPSGSSLRFDNLVFQGGGIKGLAYVGACEALSQHINFSQVKRVGGTSAGAIQALLLALNYSITECMQLMKEGDFSLFMDGEYRQALFRLQEQARDGNSSHSSITEASRWAPTVKTLKEGVGLLKRQEFGLFPGEYFREEWVEPLIQRKTGIPYLTFRELQALKASHPFKDLYIVGVNLSKSQSEVFSYETTPDVIISDALRISMSIPLIFKPHSVYLKQEGRRVPHPEKDWYVDGGLLDNYPLWLFDKACYLEQEGQRQCNPYTLGLKLVDKSKPESSSDQPDSLGSYILLILKAIHQKQNSDHRKLDDAPRTIEIDYLGISSTQFNLETVDQERLVKSGKEAVHAHFKQQISQQFTI